jgi:2-oxoglutarate/2-oxoacid ferredoxin oxidoreductase subunit alpha
MGRLFIEGNEAVARGAIKAGCDFFASYPITPASSILHYMLQWVPEQGGTAIQAEDEIASMGFCIAAAMAGKKVMTSTSGPGISLYSENIGLAIIGETPMVIVNVQRQGPATGSATKGAEGDILFTRWSTSGGLPVIALSPATVEESYELSYRAFNLAEKYRTPVFLMTSKEIGVTKEVADLDARELPPLVNRDRAPAGLERYDPHQFEAAAEVPPFAEVGGEYITRYTTSTHDKAAYLTANPDITSEMLGHYAAKIDDAIDDITLVKRDLQPDAEILVISYGIISRSAAMAVRAARAEGRKVSSLVIQSVWPLPEKAILEAMRGVKKVVVPEMNMGQYVLEIERLAPAGVEVQSVCRMDTILISPEQILTEGGLV